MNSTQGKRLKELLEYYDISQTELAKKLKIPKGSLSMYISDKRKMKQNRIKQVSDMFNVNEAWLMGFDVPMKPDEDIISESPVLQAAQRMSDNETVSNIFNKHYIQLFTEKYLNEKTMALVKAYVKADPGIQASIDKLLDIDIVSREMGESSDSQEIV